MSAERSGTSASWFLPALLILVGGSGVLISTSGLNSPRPRTDSMLWHEALDEGRAPARLWQDPLLAAEKKREEAEEAQARRAVREASAVGASGEAQAVAAEAPAVPVRLLKSLGERGRETLILGVVISGERWPGSEEGRMADRYAVLAALGACGYVPMEREYVDFFEAHTGKQYFSSEYDQSVPNSVRFLVPYEWMRLDRAVDGEKQRGVDGSENQPPRYVLVMWLRSDRLEKLRRLATLEWLLSQQLGLELPLRKESPRVAVLGPNGSNMLVDLLVEDAKGPVHLPRQHDPGLTGVRLYAWNATVSDEELRSQVSGSLKESGEWRLSPLDQLAPRRKSGEEPEAGELHAQESRPYARCELLCGATLTRTIGDDAQLADLIVRELKSRGAFPEPNESRVLLLHEWDTVYGRAMPASFRRTFMAHSNGALTKTNEPEWLTTYGYLRGIDGVVPGAKPIEETPGAPGSRPGAEPGDRPVGRSQFDYIRRLVDEIAREDDERAGRGEGRFSAVGVLGGDTYDKLVLIQAVRQAFPDVALFTTDLEARIVHPCSSPFNLNLLVASHFGLTPEVDENKGAVAAPSAMDGALAPLNVRSAGGLSRRPGPLRNSYQCAMYSATLLAVKESIGSGVKNDTKDESGVKSSNDTNSATDQSEAARPGSRARLFEIGRRGVAWPLSVKGDGAPNVLAAAGLGTRTPMVVFSLVGVSALATLGIWMFVRPLPKVGARREWLNLLVFMGVVSALLVGVPMGGVWMGASIASEGGEEPFHWASGISVWPSVVARLTASALSLAGLVWALWMLSRSARALAQALGLSARGSAERRPGRRWRRGTIGWKAPEPGVANAKQLLWKEYLDLGRPQARLARVGALSFMLAVCVVPLGLAFGWPDSPARGPLSRGVDIGLGWLGFGLVCALTVTVLDATRLTQRLIDNLRGCHGGWHEDLHRKMEREHGLRGEGADLAADMLIAESRTAIVGNLFYLPVGCALLLLFSTASIFDRWNWTLPAVLPFVLCFGLTALAAAALRSSAERSRREALRKLSALEGALEPDVSDDGGGGDDYPASAALVPRVPLPSSIIKGSVAT